jgi:DNA replicative helicase MCM subunit Mcm2 (Cdc46/Mcm family)
LILSAPNAGAQHLLSIISIYRNTRSIQLEDIGKTTAAASGSRDQKGREEDDENNIDRLELVLYDDASSHIIPGEIVDITGNIYIQRKSDSGSGKGSKKLVSVLHSNEVRYKNKEKVVITPKDIETFYKYKRICEEAYRRELEAATKLNDGALTEHKIVPMRYTDRLVAMFSPNVIGHSDTKLGLLRSLVGGSMDHGDDNGRRGRINTLLVGDPGTAKSILVRESTKLIANSRYVTAENASGKSLVGIVDKENDGLFLRLGVAVLAKGAVCAVN